MPIDVSGMHSGFHTVYLCLGEGQEQTLQSFVFYKPKQAIATNSYKCWVDQDFTNLQNGTVGSGFVIDVSSLQEGFHTLYINIGEGEEEASYSVTFSESISLIQ